MKEDSTAIPDDNDLSEQMIGVEIYKENEFLFRGGVLEATGTDWLYNEDGTLESLGFTVYTSYGVEYDENGNIIDRMEPSALNIYELINGPELTHKGEMFAWLGGAFICIINISDKCE